MLEIQEKISLWDYLKTVTKPIYIYGMGYGAEKIIKALSLYGLTPSGIFASDNFVRDHTFMGYKVQRFADIRAAHNDNNFIILLAFAAQKEPLFTQLVDLSSQYEMYAPDVPVVFDDDEVFTKEFYDKHEKEFEAVYDRLADDLSKRVLCDIINFKISGKINYLTLNTSSRDELFYNIIKPTKYESYADIGAYNGDTIEEFLHYTSGEYKNIIAVEPDLKNYKKMLTRVIEAKNLTVNSLNVGIWHEDTTLTFSAKSGRNSRLTEDGEIKVEVKSLDSIMGYDPLTIVKYDVEGAEYNALMGSRNVIMRDKPKLLVSAYHRNDDIIKLSKLILSYNGSYKMYLRHHQYIPAWETNLYFV